MVFKIWILTFGERQNAVVGHGLEVVWRGGGANGSDFAALADDYILHGQTEVNLCLRKLLDFPSPPKKHKYFLSLHSSVAQGG